MVKTCRSPIDGGIEGACSFQISYLTILSHYEVDLVQEACRGTSDVKLLRHTRLVPVHTRVTGRPSEHQQLDPQKATRQAALRRPVHSRQDLILGPPCSLLLLWKVIQLFK